MFVTVSGKKPLPYQGSENRCLKKRHRCLLTVTTSTVEQFKQSFTHKNNDANCVTKLSKKCRVGFSGCEEIGAL